MSQAIEYLVRLTSVRNEMAAGLIVAKLVELRIQAAMADETTAGFRAMRPIGEAPGQCSVRLISTSSSQNGSRPALLETWAADSFTTTGFDVRQRNAG